MVCFAFHPPGVRGVGGLWRSIHADDPAPEEGAKDVGRTKINMI